jgi:hypothetical protein
MIQSTKKKKEVHMVGLVGSIMSNSFCFGPSTHPMYVVSFQKSINVFF